MAEIRTLPVKAVHIDDLHILYGDGEEGSPVAGSFTIEKLENGGEADFYYTCPCGCGSIGHLLVGLNRKPADNPSWVWNGDYTFPTLQPSIWHKGHWHGWLTKGVWLSV